jgi:hypothetical protein
MYNHLQYGFRSFLIHIFVVVFVVVGRVLYICGRNFTTESDNDTAEAKSQGEAN